MDLSQTKNEVEHVLDTRLQEAARMVSSLVSGSGGVDRTALSSIPLSRQNWPAMNANCPARSGRSTASWWPSSSGAPGEKLSQESNGFSERTINGETWRVFAVEDAVKETRVMVGDRLGLRGRLVTDIIKGLLAPASLIIPLLGLLIWTSLGRVCGRCKPMADELQHA